MAPWAAVWGGRITGSAPVSASSSAGSARSRATAQWSIIAEPHQRILPQRRSSGFGSLEVGSSSSDARSSSRVIHEVRSPASITATSSSAVPMSTSVRMEAPSPPTTSMVRTRRSSSAGSSPCQAFAVRWMARPRRGRVRGASDSRSGPAAAGAPRPRLGTTPAPARHPLPRGKALLQG